MAIHDHFFVWRIGLASERPANPTKDMGFFATDTLVASVYDSVAAAWVNWPGTAFADPVAIADGGTGQTTQTAAFDALAPTTTNGDLIYHNGTDNVRLAVGASGKILTVASGAPAWGTAGICIPIITPTGTAYTFTTGAAYAALLANGSMNADISRFTEARINLWGAIQIGSTSATVKIVETGTPQDLGAAITLNSTTPSRKASAWTAIGTAVTDAEFELQGREVVGVDVVRIFSASLELR